ncbi:DUF5007 domain-containing protein [Bacteroides sp.]|uniref:DUF5007 domain-containing protein n=1 Tax=Bacteroides sp. TaxID=29523 RepID=UPI00258BAAAE|nr:DUF5007 domain-containing protein [Bacteroides sp.]
MKNKIFAGLAIVVPAILTSLSGCSEIPEGFIPDKIVYAQNYVIVQQGVDKTTAAPNVNGASYPLKFRLLPVKDKDGNITTILTDSVTTRIWKEPYDYKTDKTLDAINAKLTEEKLPVMTISEAAGQVRFSSASSEVPSGEYTISVEMSNSAGTRVYNDVFVASLERTKIYDHSPSPEYSWADENIGWSNGETPATYEIINDEQGPNEIHLYVYDKNDTPFSWEKGEIILRGDDRSSFEQVSFDDPIYSDEKAVYKYPFAPFPFGSGGSTGLDFYYRIPKQYVKYDNPERGGYMNIVFHFQALIAGTWTIKIHYPHITRIPG